MSKHAITVVLADVLGLRGMLQSTSSANAGISCTVVRLARGVYYGCFGSMHEPKVHAAASASHLETIFSIFSVVPLP